jgi:drug/metabolite transporter (DMT)-like permease
MKKLKGELLLLITAIIWGTSFISQKLGMNYIEPFTFGASRFLIGAMGLVGIGFVFDAIEKKKLEKSGIPKTKVLKPRDLVIGGILCGVALFLGASFQQIGIVETTAGKAGFITALYILLVPIFGIFMNKRVGALTWVGVGIAVIGLYLLCVTEGFTMQRGDLIVLIGTLFWALQIIIVDHFNDRTDGIKLSCVQFITAGILSAIAAFLFEEPNLAEIITCAGPILYTAVMVVGVAFTLQIIGQKSTPPTVAAVIMSLESVFAVISGAIFLGESMNARELTGCALVFAAVLLTQFRPSGLKEEH